MGLFDGASGRGELASTAHVAKLLRRAGGARGRRRRDGALGGAAIVHGFRTFDPELDVAGVIFNRVGSDHHEQLLREAVDAGVPVLGALRRDERDRRARAPPRARARGRARGRARAARAGRARRRGRRVRRPRGGAARWPAPRPHAARPGLGPRRGGPRRRRPHRHRARPGVLVPLPGEPRAAAGRRRRAACRSTRSPTRRCPRRRRADPRRRVPGGVRRGAGGERAAARRRSRAFDGPDPGRVRRAALPAATSSTATRCAASCRPRRAWPAG